MMPDRETVKTQSRYMRHNETHGNSGQEPRPDIQVSSKDVVIYCIYGLYFYGVETEPRPRHEKPCLETVFRRDTCLETASLVKPLSKLSN